MDLEKELRIIVGFNDIILFLCKKLSNFDRELVSDGQLTRMCVKESRLNQCERHSREVNCAQI